MCWDFVGMTIEKVKVSCKLQRIVFNFIITFSTKGVLKWRMFGMYLEIGLHISYISHWNWKETVTYIYWTALFLDHKRPSCMPLTFLIMKISYWIYAANNLGNKCQLNTYMWVLDISGQNLGAGRFVGVPVRPSGTLLGNINLYWIYAANTLGIFFYYYIYHANSFGMNVSWVVFVPFRAGDTLFIFYLCLK